MNSAIQGEKPLNEKEVLQNASDAIIEEGIPFEIIVANQNILHKLNILKTSRNFIIKPLHFGTIIRMSKILIGIDEVEKLDNYIAEGIESISKHANKLVEVIALAIIDSKNKPTLLLKRFILKNLSAIEINQILNIVVKQMRIMEFLQSIVLIKGLSQMEKLMRNKTENVPKNTETSGEQSDQQ